MAGFFLDMLKAQTTKEKTDELDIIEIKTFMFQKILSRKWKDPWLDLFDTKVKPPLNTPRAKHKSSWLKK